MPWLSPPPPAPALVAQATPPAATSRPNRLVGPRALVQRFFYDFNRQNGPAMAALYAPQATFTDPVFPCLKGPEVGGMWRMLTAGGGDLTVELTGLEEKAWGVEATWVARYTFTATGQKVVNRVRSRFAFQGEQVVAQQDAFDLPEWLGQAFGPFGQAWGRTAWMQGMIQGVARRQLDAFLAKEALKGPPPVVR